MVEVPAQLKPPMGQASRPWAEGAVRCDVMRAADQQTRGASTLCNTTTYFPSTGALHGQLRVILILEEDEVAGAAATQACPCSPSRWSTDATQDRATVAVLARC